MIDLTPYIARYQRGEWRSPIFRDILLEEMSILRKEGPLRLLDIGCGRGFDSEPQLQKEIAARADNYVGVEPDTEISIEPIFSLLSRTTLEEADLPPESIDLAFSVMVLEHVANPQQHWEHIYRVLRPGGVFWGFTIDARHWFSIVSSTVERLRIKNAYLTMLSGRRGEERYENYPVHYRTNRPSDISRFTARFSRTDALNLRRQGQVDGYVPRLLRPLVRGFDGLVARQGIHLAIRAQK